MSRPTSGAVARRISRPFVLITLFALVIGPVAAAPGGTGGPGAPSRLVPVGPAPIDDGLLTELVADAMLRSGETGQWERVA